ncbi:hypothetical protein [Paenibacillus sacheonensis]|uniref:Uncharacterized protein n=1 Tax=Paenibacillus sacheonensis TaxID=742054 RepID=A0A7X4YL17_9BACL|nr:hypothetical protein [Paenibacillus sacheonensis]MBM7563177.1 hypothetical protein [Paenibacillus sacheonensis]NBC68260.1 hypothetical protein [Paenibacillus sacheonensis]
MNSSVKSVVRMHMKDRLSWFYLPWCIMLSSFVINLILAGTMQEEQLVTGGLASIFIYMLVSGIVSVQHTFPFALGFSVRRRDYYSGSMVMIVAVSLFTSILLCLLSYIEDASGGWAVELYFFHIPYITDGNALQQLVVFASVLLFMYLLGFAISSLNRRFGKMGLYTAAIASLVLGTLFVYGVIYLEWWKGIFDFFDGRSAFEVGLLLLPVSIVLSGISYALLRRSTV